ncbi:hypothetical protein TIFTF001_030572 [Ficus carica]|uniref:Uncharacterized protein n=1 Tax=Ficus carica TaxID=3494 RepID=A0AA88DTS7_FICCA|nr:hypothetical protein TIFTF001_030572 [Ficus carica]
MFFESGTWGSRKQFGETWLTEGLTGSRWKVDGSGQPLRAQRMVQPRVPDPPRKGAERCCLLVAVPPS